MNTKIEILDSLRAFAALSVCLFHFVCTTTGYIQNYTLLRIFSAGQYGVQLFFVISGFIIPWAMYHARYKIRHFFRFLLKRLARLEPPYIFSIVLALIVLYLRQHYFGRPNEHMHVTVKQVALHLGYMIPFFEGYKWLNQVYWTLAIEFQYYLLIALLFVPLMKSGHVVRYFIYVLVIVLSIISAEKFIFYWLPVFALGILLFLFKVKKIQKEEYYVVSILFLSFSCFKYPVASVFYSFVPLICILYFENSKIFFLHTIGKFSYSIYLVHSILGASLINILSHRFVSLPGKILVISGGVIFTVFCAWVTYLLIEKPSKKLSSSINYQIR